MKTKKILVIALSCLLLIGAMVGFTASAAEGDPSVSIRTLNVSYEGAIKLVYTLDTANIPDGGEAKILFSYNKDVTVPSGNVLTINEGEYVNGITVYGSKAAVFSNGIPTYDMTKTVYAVPVIVDGSDTVLTSGKTIAFSVYDYFMKRFDGSGTPITQEQYELYVASLDFGGYVQAAMKANDKSYEPAGGHYANEYYRLNITDGDGVTTEQYFSEPTEVKLVAPKSNSESKLFDHFADKEGTAYESNFRELTVKVNKIGTTYVQYVYGDTSINVEGITGTTAAPAELANPNTSVIVKGGTEYYLDANINLTTGAEAHIAFMADEDTKICTISLSEANGVVTVDDGVSTFTMANGADFKIEYTVISTTANTGAIFYYVDGAYFAKSDISSVEGTSNATFAKVVASTTVGEIAVTNVIIGANDGYANVNNNTTNTTASIMYDNADGKKYFYINKPSQNLESGSISFDIQETAGNVNVFEADIKLTGQYAPDTKWRNFLNITLRSPYDTSAGKYSTVNDSTRFAFTTDKLGIGPSVLADAINENFHDLGCTISGNEWFHLKIVATYGANVEVYVNNNLVYTLTATYPSTKFGNININPSDYGSGSLSFKNIEFYAQSQ